MITSRRARNTTFAALAAMASLSLVACGSDPGGTAAEPGSSGSSGGANASGLTCPSGKLSAEGSTAQGNAITDQAGLPIWAPAGGVAIGAPAVADNGLWLQ